MSIQALVPDVVWWPANIMEMKIPVTSLGVNRWVPSSFLIDTNTSRRSRSSLSAGGFAIRSSMIAETSSTRPSRAASRRRNDSMSAYGSMYAWGSVPCSRSWYRCANRASSCSRNFGPMRHADEV